MQIYYIHKYIYNINMAQSDYLKYKRVSNQLKIDGQRFSPILDAQDYVNYKEYKLENTIINTQKTFNQLLPTGRQPVFGMEKVVTNCPSFIVCSGTNNRPYRVPMLASYFTPTPQPLSIKATKNAANQKSGCKCVLDSKYTNANLCSCKLGGFGIVR